MGLLQDVARAERNGVISRGMASALVRLTAERVVSAGPLNPKAPEDVPPAVEPDGGDEDPPAKKKTKTSKKKGKSKAMSTHRTMMQSSATYRRAFKETRALHDASAPISAKTREALAVKASASPFAPAGLLGAEAGGGHRHGGDIKALSSEDASAIAMGYPSHEGYLAARALIGLPNQAEHVIVSTLPVRLGLADGRDMIAAPQKQSLEESERDLKAAKQKAGV